MDYKAHYDRLIERARGRVLVGYRERHHVRPVCMGGGNEAGNIVELTPEEHLVAHQLLVKLNPRNGRLAHAANLMVGRFGNNKRYGWVRRRHAAALSQELLGNKRTLGYAHTDEAKAKIAATHRGAKRSAETRAKMSTAALGNTRVLGKKLPPFTEEHRAKMSAAKVGKPSNRRGIASSAETIIKLRAAHQGASGKAKPVPKKRFTPEHSAKIAEALRGIKRPPQTPEHRAKLAAAMHAYWSSRSTSQLVA